MVHVFHHKGIVRFWCHNAREQIRCDTIEKDNIIGSKLGKIDVIKGAQSNLIFGPIELAEKASTSSQNSF